MTRKASRPLAAFASFTLTLVLGVVGALSLALADSAPPASAPPSRTPPVCR